jgi:DNA polymerase III subunit beta
MKVECLQEKLKKAVMKAERVTGKHLSLPILSCIKLTAEGGTLTLRATNLEIGLEISLPVKVIEEGSIAVAGSVLASFLSNLPEDRSLLLETKGETLVIKTKHVSTIIKTQASDDFPTIPKVTEGVTVSVAAASLIKGFRSVVWSASLSSVKPELGSVSLRAEDDSLIFVATDSFRLAERRLSVGKGIEFPEVLIPAKSVNDITRILDGEEGDCKLSVGDNQCVFEMNGIYVVTRTIDASFPNYGQIIPKESKTEAVALKSDVLQALRLSTIFADSFNQVNFKVSPKEKLCVITTKNAEVGENSSQIEAALTGEAVEVNFNHRYISDAFQAIDSDSVIFLWNGLGKALVVKGVGDAGFLYLVMPMNR